MHMIILQGGGFKATVKIILAKKKAKALISFTFDEETFSVWPHSIRNVKMDVDVVYGPVRWANIHTHDREESLLLIGSITAATSS
jgi:hypothetical protein